MIVCIGVFLSFPLGLPSVPYIRIDIPSTEFSKSPRKSEPSTSVLGVGYIHLIYHLMFTIIIHPLEISTTITWGIPAAFFFPEGGRRGPQT